MVRPLRVEPDFAAADDLARAEAGLAAPADLDAVLRDFDAVPRGFAAVLPDFDPALRDDDDPDFDARDAVPDAFDAVDPDALRPLLDRLALPPDDPPLLLSLDHLPLITRCAASATASAMMEPSLVALDNMLPAARSAVSAASSPASRIFLRAAGLALIAAAAAARPAASISLLIAALASLSTELSFEPELDEPDAFDEVERDELFRADLAMYRLPPLRGIDTSRPFRFPNEVGSDQIQIM